MDIIRFRGNEEEVSNKNNKLLPQITELDTAVLVTNTPYTYKSLCLLLNLPAVAGSQKKRQLLELSRWFNYEKIGSKYFISEIYPSPLPYLPVTSSSKYASDVIDILTSYIYNSGEQVLYLKPIDLSIICGLANQRYARYHQNEDQTQLAKELKLLTSDISSFYLRTDSYFRDVLVSSLNSMKNRGIIQYVETYVIRVQQNNNEAILREATTEDRQCIIELQKEAMQRQGIKDIRELWLNEGKKKKYYEELDLLMKEARPDWLFYYKTYKLYYSYKVLSEVTNKDQIKRDLNLKVFQFLNNQSVKQYITSMNSEHPYYTEAWLSAQRKLSDYLITLYTE